MSIRFPVLILLCALRATAQTAPERHLVQDLRLDNASEDFDGLGSVLVGPQGQMVVTLFTDQQVRFYDAAGKRYATFGRKGSGPAEFQRMTRSGWTGDTVWIYDSSLRRMTYISLAGKLIRSAPLADALNRGMVGGGRLDEVGAVMSFSPSGVVPSGALVGLGSVVSAVGPGGKPVTKRQILATAITGGRHKSLGEPPAIDAFVRVEGPGSSSSSAIPFVFQSATAFADDGTRFGTMTVEMGDNGGTYTVSTFSTDDGAPLYKRSFPFVGTPIPSRVLDSAVNQMGLRDNGTSFFPNPQTAEKLRALAREKLPKFYSPVSTLVLGTDGTTWITFRRTDAGRPVIVLDEKGNSLFKVTLPLRNLLLAANRTTVWAMETDEDGLASLVRYRIK